MRPARAADLNAVGLRYSLAMLRKTHDGKHRRSQRRRSALPVY